MLYTSGIQGLVRATCELMEDDDVLAQLSLDARQTMVDLCNWDNQITKLENLLMETIEETR